MRNMEDIIKVPLLKTQIERRILELNEQAKAQLDKAWVKPEGSFFKRRDGSADFIPAWQTSSLYYTFESADKVFELAAQEKIWFNIWRELGDREEVCRQDIKNILMKMFEFVSILGRSSSFTHNIMEAMLADQIKKFLYDRYEMSGVIYQAQRDDEEFQAFREEEARIAKQKQAEADAAFQIKFEARKNRVKEIINSLKPQLKEMDVDAPRVWTRDGTVFVSTNQLWGGSLALVKARLQEEFGLNDFNGNSLIVSEPVASPVAA